MRNDNLGQIYKDKMKFWYTNIYIYIWSQPKIFMDIGPLLQWAYATKKVVLIFIK